jgi:TonB family protein
MRNNALGGSKPWILAGAFGAVTLAALLSPLARVTPAVAKGTAAGPVVVGALVRIGGKQTVAVNANCTSQDRDAGITTLAPVQYPEIAYQQGVEGTATVEVDLTSNGNVRDTSIVETAGNQSLDREAQSVLAHSAYAPEVSNCESRAGSYLVSVEFQH